MATPNYQSCTPKATAPANVKNVTQYASSPNSPPEPGKSITLYDASNNVVQVCDKAFLDANFTT